MLGISLPPVLPTEAGGAFGWLVAALATAFVAVFAWAMWRVGRGFAPTVEMKRPEERKAA